VRNEVLVTLQTPPPRGGRVSFSPQVSQAVHLWLAGCTMLADMRVQSRMCRSFMLELTELEVISGHLRKQSAGVNRAASMEDD
jgi:hypothetical protein